MAPGTRSTNGGSAASARSRPPQSRATAAEMKLDDPDRKLDQLREAAERIKANLVELELDSSRQLLEASTLEGESAARSSAASDALTELWRRHGLLEALLQHADKQHGSRRAD